MWWNFVARSRDEITGAYEQWRAEDGRFGEVHSALDRIPAPPPPWLRSRLAVRARSRADPGRTGAVGEDRHRDRAVGRQAGQVAGPAVAVAAAARPTAPVRGDAPSPGTPRRRRWSRAGARTRSRRRTARGRPGHLDRAGGPGPAAGRPSGACGAGGGGGRRRGCRRARRRRPPRPPPLPTARPADAEAPPAEPNGACAERRHRVVGRLGRRRGASTRRPASTGRRHRRGAGVALGRQRDQQAERDHHHGRGRPGQHLAGQPAPVQRDREAVRLERAGPAGQLGPERDGRPDPAAATSSARSQSGGACTGGTRPGQRGRREPEQRGDLDRAEPAPAAARPPRPRPPAPAPPAQALVAGQREQPGPHPVRVDEVGDRAGATSSASSTASGGLVGPVGVRVGRPAGTPRSRTGRARTRRTRRAGRPRPRRRVRQRGQPRTEVRIRRRVAHGGRTYRTRTPGRSHPGVAGQPNRPDRVTAAEHRHLGELVQYRCVHTQPGATPPPAAASGPGRCRRRP